MWTFLLFTVFLFVSSEGRHISVIRRQNPKTFVLKENPTPFFNPLDDKKIEETKVTSSYLFKSSTVFENSTKAKVETEVTDVEKYSSEEASTSTLSSTDNNFSLSTNVISVTQAIDFYDYIEIVTTKNIKTTDFYVDLDIVTNIEEKTTDFYYELGSASGDFGSSTDATHIEAKSTDFYDDITTSFEDDEDLATAKFEVTTLLPIFEGSGSGSGDGDKEDGSGSGSGDGESDFESSSGSGSGSGDLEDYLVTKKKKSICSEKEAKRKSPNDVLVEDDFVFIDEGYSPPLGRKEGPYWEMVPKKRDPFLSDKILTLEELIPENDKETTTVSILATTDFSDKSLFDDIISPEAIESELGISKNDYLVIIDGYEFKSEDTEPEKEFSSSNY